MLSNINLQELIFGRLTLEAIPYHQETDRRLLPLREEREHYWSQRANLPWA